MISKQRLQEILNAVDYHLKMLKECQGGLIEIQQSVKQSLRAQEEEYFWELEKLKTQVSSITNELVKRGLPHQDEYEQKYNSIVESVNDSWPAAVEGEAICDSEEKAQMRAQEILDYMVCEQTDNKKILDYGCGQGHLIQLALPNAQLAVGYDVDDQLFQFEGSNYLTDFERVKAKGPYDVIIVHDVLDHIVLINPIEALRQVRSVLAPAGRVYLRCHPWSSRHGGHLYEQINKAYLHLVLDENELQRMGDYTCMHNVKVVDPIGTYRHWIDMADLQIQQETPITSSVEPFFQKPSFFKERLLQNWEGDESKMVPAMEIEFVEYILESQSKNKIF